MTFAPPDVHRQALSVDVTHLKVECFTQAQAERISGEDKNAVTQVFGVRDEAIDFTVAENVG